jgi:hypothetical protein
MPLSRLLTCFRPRVAEDTADGKRSGTNGRVRLPDLQHLRLREMIADLGPNFWCKDMSNEFGLEQSHMQAKRAASRPASTATNQGSGEAHSAAQQHDLPVRTVVQSPKWSTSANGKEMPFATPMGSPNAAPHATHPDTAPVLGASLSQTGQLHLMHSHTSNALHSESFTSARSAGVTIARATSFESASSLFRDASLASQSSASNEHDYADVLWGSSPGSSPVRGYRDSGEGVAPARQRSGHARTRSGLSQQTHGNGAASGASRVDGAAGVQVAGARRTAESAMVAAYTASAPHDAQRMARGAGGTSLSQQGTRGSSAEQQSRMHGAFAGLQHARPQATVAKTAGAGGDAASVHHPGSSAHAVAALQGQRAQWWVHHERMADAWEVLAGSASYVSQPGHAGAGAGADALSQNAGGVPQHAAPASAAAAKPQSALSLQPDRHAAGAVPAAAEPSMLSRRNEAWLLGLDSVDRPLTGQTATTAASTASVAGDGAIPGSPIALADIVGLGKIEGSFRACSAQAASAWADFVELARGGQRWHAAAAALARLEEATGAPRRELAECHDPEEGLAIVREVESMVAKLSAVDAALRDGLAEGYACNSGPPLQVRRSRCRSLRARLVIISCKVHHTHMLLCAAQGRVTSTAPLVAVLVVVDAAQMSKPETALRFADVLPAHAEHDGALLPLRH